MSPVLEGLAVLVGIPALVGLALPGLLRRVVGVGAAIAATILWLRGLNVHGPSTPLFFVSGGIALGALLREVATLALRALRPARGRP